MSPVKKEGESGAEEVQSDWEGMGLKPKQRALLEAYSNGGGLRRAATASGVSRRSHSRWMKSDEGYAEAFELAKEYAGQALEAEAHRRAVEGVVEPVFYKGVICGYRELRSDILLMFLLKGANPEKYRDRADVTHRGGGEPIAVNVNLAAEMLAQGNELMKKVLAAAKKPGVPGLGGD